jgi:hypothetical protein
LADPDTIRIEVAFEGGAGFSALVTLETAAELERALAEGRAGTVAVDGSDGRYSVVLQHVVYLKRDARESRVGFGI